MNFLPLKYVFVMNVDRELGSLVTMLADISSHVKCQTAEKNFDYVVFVYKSVFAKEKLSTCRSLI